MLSSRAPSSLLVVSTLLLINCGFSENRGAGGTAGTGGGGLQNGDASSAGGTSGGTGGANGASGGAGDGGSTGTGGTGGNPYSNPDGGVIMCMPGVAGTGITACGYPYSSSTPLTGTVF